MKTLATIAGVLALALPFAAPADEAGKIEYMNHCAACHGESAVGDGPLAELMTVPVPDLTQVSAKERAAHQKAMLDAHKERFKDAYWTQTVPIIEQQKTQDVFLESPGHRINGANKKFVVPTDRPTRSLAPKDVDDHLFTGIHRGAESEQMAINRMIRNDEIDFEKLHTQAK